MYAPPTTLPRDAEGFRRAVEEEFRNLADILQTIGTGQAYPHGKAGNRKQFWEDELASFSSARVTGASQPTWAAMRNGVYGWQFSATATNELWPAPFHITHTYKPGTAIYPHIHWCSPGTNTGVVRWGIEYTFAKGHAQGADSVFPATQTIYLEQAATGTAYEHMIAEASDVQAIDSANIEVDALLLTRVFRDGGNAADTCTDAVFGLMCDLHYQKGYWATRNKSPDFYK